MHVPIIWDKSRKDKKEDTCVYTVCLREKIPGRGEELFIYARHLHLYTVDRILIF